MAGENKRPIRCAIYTRKSTDEGLSSDFNSLDAQREAGEAFIRSQMSEGLLCLPARYDDGGFSGGNMERPALKRLLKDIDAGLIDCCIVYKVDRLSRSLLDFTTLINTFDKNDVTFVSVTQSFNTTTSMGRLTLNILLSFAQFEREIIGERIRDKVAAAKKKGKHTGGVPVIGYDSVNTKLVVNTTEGKTVQQIFRRFLLLRSPAALAKELNDQGVTMKSWKTNKGTVHAGSRWSKASIYTLLRNRKYIGEIKHGENYYPGEHQAIIERRVWDQAQDVFRENARDHIRERQTPTPALLKGILRCGHCGCSMGITYAKGRNRIYRYYQCSSASKVGFHSCPVKIVPAGDIESAVIAQLREMLRTPEVLAKAHRAVAGEEPSINPQEFTAALLDIDQVWAHLFPVEQARICRLLLESVTVNPDSLRIRLYGCGLAQLVGEMHQGDEDV